MSAENASNIKLLAVAELALYRSRGLQATILNLALLRQVSVNAVIRALGFVVGVFAISIYPEYPRKFHLFP